MQQNNMIIPFALLIELFTYIKISFYFYMKIPEHFSSISKSFPEDNSKEFLKWLSPGDETKKYPDFFRTELVEPLDYVRYFVNDER